MKAMAAWMVAGACTFVTGSAIACPAPATYLTSVEGNTVRVLSQRACSADATLLREDIVTGAIVRVSATCASGWFVDACVAPGQYRYGLESPSMPPDSSCTCGPYEYYGAATVSQALPNSCASQDVADPDGVAWSDDPTICEPTSTCSDQAPGAPCGTVDAGPAAQQGSAGGCDITRSRPGSRGIGAAIVGLACVVALRRRRARCEG